MPNPYDDPRLASALVIRLKFERIGDRAKGVVTAVDVFSTANGNGLTYTLAEVACSQDGHQSRLGQAEIMAGSRNLLGQMMTKQPMVGDVLDVELTELRPSPAGNPLKVFRVDVTPSGATPPPATATPPPAATTPVTTPPAPATSSEDDIFNS